MSALVKQLSHKLKQTNNVLTTAESCTGGMIAAAITDLSGSSAIFDRGFVTYSNQSKMDLLAVPNETLSQHGAVSKQTASYMAQGALKNAQATIAVSVTGIAGPTGNTPDKPVGLVFIGLAQTGKPTIVIKNIFKGDRASIRQQTVETAFELILEHLD